MFNGEVPKNGVEYILFFEDGLALGLGGVVAGVIVGVGVEEEEDDEDEEEEEEEDVCTA